MQPPCCVSHPYRSSAGTLELPPSPPQSGVRHVRPHSPVSSCSSCDDEDTSLPLRTPWSSPPTSASGSHTSSHASRRHRSGSVREARHPIARTVPALMPAPHSRGGSGSGGALVVHVDQKSKVPSPVEKTYVSANSKQIIIPASSSSSRREGARYGHSSNYATYSSTSSRRHERETRDRYRDVDIRRERARSRSRPRTRGTDIIETETTRRGTTKFPRGRVSREACSELGYPFIESDDSVITIQEALSSEEIDRVVDLTEDLRRHRGHSPSAKAVSFHENAVVYENPPIAPSPPPMTIVPLPSSSRRASLVDDDLAYRESSRYHNEDIVTSHTSAYSSPPPRVVPLKHAGPSAPKPRYEYETPSMTLPGKSAEEKIARAEEKAIKADQEALRKEAKADSTGRARDEHEAFRARKKADDTARKLEDKIRKLQLKDEERHIRRMEDKEKEVRVGRNRKGEVVLIKG